jgi:hypothetical protein
MATSVTNTAYGIICDAMVDAGYLQEGDRPNSEQLASGMRRLNDIINLWQTQGLKLFFQEEINVPLQVGQTLYVLGPDAGSDVVMAKPARILSGYVTVVTSNVRRPLVIISRDEWDRLSQVAGNDGTINSFFVDKQATQLNLNLWPPPDSTEVLNTATFLTQVQAINPILLTDNTSFPQEWRIALRWGLADDICTGQPVQIQQRCAQKSMAFRQALENWDVEDAPTYFNVDQRMYQQTGKFK